MKRKKNLGVKAWSPLTAHLAGAGAAVESSSHRSGAELGRLGGGTSRWRRADVTGVGRPSASSTGRGARPVVSVAGRRPLARLFALRPDEALVAELPQPCCGRRGSRGSSESGNGGERGGLGSPCLPVSVGQGRAGSASRKRRSAPS